MMTHQSSNLAKHSTGNPVVRGLLDRYFRTLRGIVEPLKPAKILDVGCGEGVTAARLGEMPFAFDYLGIDLDGNAVEHARTTVSGREFRQGSIFEIEERADLVVCLEVIEHLADPDAAFARLRKAAISHCVVSVPWEPWFRLGNLARGKYLGRLGNHPEHIQAFSPRSIGDAMARHFGPTTVTTSFPWVFAHARVS